MKGGNSMEIFLFSLIGGTLALALFSMAKVDELEKRIKELEKANKE